MIIVHNVMIRGINCVHRQAVRVTQEGSAQDKMDFANFAAQWGQMLHHHHDLEETMIFPRFCEEVGDPNLMDGPLAEHREFDEGLEKYNGYLKDVKEGKEELDGEKLRAIVDEVIPAVHRHLVLEIDELLSLGKHEHVDWEALFQELVQASANKDMKESWYRVSLATQSARGSQRKKADEKSHRLICFRWCCICTIRRMRREPLRASHRYR